MNKKMLTEQSEGEIEDKNYESSDEKASQVAVRNLKISDDFVQEFINGLTIKVEELRDLDLII